MWIKKETNLHRFLDVKMTMMLPFVISNGRYHSALFKQHNNTPTRCRLVFCCPESTTSFFNTFFFLLLRIISLADTSDEGDRSGWLGWLQESRFFNTVKSGAARKLRLPEIAIAILGANPGNLHLGAPEVKYYQNLSITTAKTMTRQRYRLTDVQYNIGCQHNISYRKH